MEYNAVTMARGRSSERSADKSSVPVHRHCIVCGRPVELNRDTCSEQCENDIAKRRKSQRRSTWIFVGLLGGMAVVFLFLIPLCTRFTQPPP